MHQQNGQHYGGYPMQYNGYSTQNPAYQYYRGPNFQPYSYYTQANQQALYYQNYQQASQFDNQNQCFVHQVSPFYTPQPQRIPSRSTPLRTPQEGYRNEELNNIPPNPNNFTFKKKLGEGIFGTVYEVVEVLNGMQRRFAVKRIANWKLMSQKELNDCKREISLLQMVQHENVIKCYGYYEEKSSLMILLEFADGGDLKKAINDHNKQFLMLEEPQIWRYFHQISLGLQALHEEGILHRDLKPENIFLTSRGGVKIGDLGLSRTLTQTQKNLTIKVGTPYYMAPEKINSPKYDYKSDVWGLGCLLYEMAVQRSPFYGECSNSFALIKKIEQSDYPPIPSFLYSDQLTIVVFHCMHPKPTDRPTLEELINASNYMLSIFSELEYEQNHLNYNVNNDIGYLVN